MIEALGYLSALVMGLALGVVGGGGSILTVPILVYFFGFDGIEATSSSLFVVGVTALMGAVLSAHRRTVDFRTAALFAGPSFAGVFLARRVLLNWIPDAVPLPMNLLVTKSMAVLASFSIIMMLAGLTMIRSGRARRIQPEVRHTKFQVATKGFWVGGLTGFVGAGGGFLIIPTLVAFLHLPMRLAIGTSLAIIAVNSLFGFAVTYNPESTDWSLLGLITALGIAGLVVGHVVSRRVSESSLKRQFGYFVLVVGLIVLVEQSLRIV